TDGQGYFHSARTVDGQTVYGSDTTDGGWISDDGKTAIDKDGKVQHGITDPNTHNFLPDGTTHTLPDGTVLYGFTVGGDFYSDDGTIIVLANGTVLHGKTDTSTGIFTPTDGNGVYLILKSGIVHGRTDPIDNSIITDGGQRYMTPGSYKVDLQALANSIVVIQRQRDRISDTFDQINTRMSGLDAYWKGPAAETFDPVRTWYTQASSDLLGILDEIITRMTKSHDNYQDAESKNAANVTSA
ncbi:WXG100 family type VII secretion target, partial [Actinoallomurus soli]|uniref:WXG100 family type VII secretion target n=1 Tax=Actinoallomurus soli TaxID=2952535 RepID=UPI002093DC97